MVELSQSHRAPLCGQCTRHSGPASPAALLYVALRSSPGAKRVKIKINSPEMSKMKIGKVASQAGLAGQTTLVPNSVILIPNIF